MPKRSFSLSFNCQTKKKQDVHVPTYILRSKDIENHTINSPVLANICSSPPPGTPPAGTSPSSPAVSPPRFQLAPYKLDPDPLPVDAAQTSPINYRRREVPASVDSKLRNLPGIRIIPSSGNLALRYSSLILGHPNPSLTSPMLLELWPKTIKKGKMAESEIFQGFLALRIFVCTSVISGT